MKKAFFKSFYNFLKKNKGPFFVWKKVLFTLFKILWGLVFLAAVSYLP